MREKLAKLIDVKSIMTLALTGGFIGLTCVGEITGDQFLTIYTVIVGFYFGLSLTKKIPRTRQHPGENNRKLHRCNYKMGLKRAHKNDAVSHTLVTDYTKTP